MTRKVLIEASGSLTAAYLVKAIQAAGYLCVASDIADQCAARYLADDFLVMPLKNDPGHWKFTEGKLKEKKIDMVIPSLDELLLGWSERREHLQDAGINVIVSEVDTIAICLDKWKTYEFFLSNGIPTPMTSLEQRYPLLKPRYGRGGQGIELTSQQQSMEGMVSQEVLEGTEYTVDIFCNRDHYPVYIVPRRRLNVSGGKSTGGITENHHEIHMWVSRICHKMKFLGPVNIQCFVEKNGKPRFLEINPRIAGGMALGFAATENWIQLMSSNIIDGKPIVPKPIRWGLRMMRYYAEVFVPYR